MSTTSTNYVYKPKPTNLSTKKFDKVSQFNLSCTWEDETTTTDRLKKDLAYCLRGKERAETVVRFHQYEIKFWQGELKSFTKLYNDTKKKLDKLGKKAKA